MLCHPDVTAHPAGDAANSRVARLKSVAVRPLSQSLDTMNAKIRRSSRAAATGCAALLLPFLAAADSQLTGGTRRGALAASAPLDFKIIIPRVLSMDLETGGPGEWRGSAEGRAAQAVAIYANSHNATLGATSPSSDQARGNIILSSAARKVISQQVLCAAGSAGPSPSREGGPRPLGGWTICTVSMP